MASISLRQSIAWLPEPSSEPTSTVVLTSPQRRFVDVRLVLPAGEQGPSVDAGAEPGLTLEWAFAGTSSSTPLAADSASPDAPTAPAARRGEWRHWVDSLHDAADGDDTAFVDEGVCVEQPDGTMLETGEMVNPATGRVTPYEEVWLDIAPMAVAPSPRPRCVVLQLQEGAGAGQDRRRRGVVEVLGQFCQGIVRAADDGITVERWQWAAVTTAEAPAWRRVFRDGRGSLPCEAAIQKAADLRAGDTVLCGVSTWTVVEAVDV